MKVMAPLLTRSRRHSALLKVGYYLPLDTVRPSRRLECFVLYSLSKIVFHLLQFRWKSAIGYDLFTRKSTWFSAHIWS